MLSEDKNMHQMCPVIVLILSLISIKTDLANTLAQPKSFTDDPFIDDEKFTEKGKILYNLLITLFH